MKRLLVAALVLAAASSAFATDVAWLRLDTEHFAVYFAPNEGPTATRFAQSAERLRERVIVTLGQDIDTKVDVHLAPSREVFNSLQPAGRAPEWAAGTAIVEELRMVMFSPADAWGEGVRGESADVFVHELTHLYLYEALGGRHAPRWFDEGLARMVAGEWHTQDEVRLTFATLFNRLIPLNDLVRRWPAASERAGLAYAESLSLVMFIRQRGWLTPLIESLQDGYDAPDALRRATGLSLPQLEKRWRKHLRAHHTWLAILDQTLMWGLLALLLVGGWLLIRRRRRRQYDRLDEPSPRSRPLREDQLDEYIAYEGDVDYIFDEPEDEWEDEEAEEYRPRRGRRKRGPSNRRRDRRGS
jgi:hypothetical protein